MEVSNKQISILDRIDSGEISVQDAITQLESPELSGISDDCESGEKAEKVKARDYQIPKQFLRRKLWWNVFFWSGLVITIMAGLLLYKNYQSIDAGFILSSIVMVIGLILLVIGVRALNSPWIHLHVNQKGDSWPKNISFSFPISTRLLSWLVKAKFVRGSIPENINVSGLPFILNSLNTSSPLTIDVDEEDEKVKIYIG